MRAWRINEETVGVMDEKCGCFMTYRRNGASFEVEYVNLQRCASYPRCCFSGSTARSEAQACFDKDCVTPKVQVQFDE